MIVMGLDLATRSGWAVRDSVKHRSSIQCGTFSLKEYEWEEKYAVAANLFYRLLKEHRPDFVAIERPEHGVRQFKKKGKADLTGEEQIVSTINPAALQLTGIAGSVIGICMMMKIPYGTIAATSWRPIYYGKGFVPPQNPVMHKGVQVLDKFGKLKFENDWKAAAIETCQRENIQLPRTKEEAKDAAEAVGVCGCWHKCDVPGIDWMQRRFMDLRTGAYEQKRAAA